MKNSLLTKSAKLPGLSTAPGCQPRQFPWSSRAKALALEILYRQEEWFSVPGFIRWCRNTFLDATVEVIHQRAHYFERETVHFGVPEVRISVKFKLNGNIHDPHYFMDIVQKRVGKSAVVTGGSMECPDDPYLNYCWARVELRAVKLTY